MTKMYFKDLIEDRQKDDIIILGLIVFLLASECRDREIIILLAILYFSDKIKLDSGILSYFGSFFNSDD